MGIRLVYGIPKEMKPIGMPYDNYLASANDPAMVVRNEEAYLLQDMGDHWHPLHAIRGKRGWKLLEPSLLGPRP